MPDLAKIYLFRITHINNIPHILQYGITHRISPNANPSFTPIGDTSLISTRNDLLLNNGKHIGEYIPFYFGTRMPMLYVVQNGFNMAETISPENIIYCVSSVQKIIDLGLDFIFTDGHAVNKLTTQYNNETDINNINEFLDWNAIKAKYWKDDSDLDKKRRKEAEFLVHGDISAKGILGFLVYNDNAFKKLLSFGVSEEKIRVKKEAYF